MGFGIKLMPGVRIRASSRGVRLGVGPRYARAHVGTRGAGVSVGPRAARAYVGTQGSFVSSRVGPVQAGPGGIGVKVGAGPASVWLSPGRATVVAGGGPFWLGLPFRATRNKSRYASQREHAFRDLYGDSNVRPAPGAEYDAYQDRLRDAGVRRRNEVEMAAAHVRAHLFDMAPMMLVAQRYPQPRRPAIPPLPTAKEYRAAAKANVSKRSDRVITWLPRGRRLVEEEIGKLEAETGLRRAALKSAASEAYERFRQLDPAINMLVLQAAFADNGCTAAPIAIDGDTLTVLMSFPEPTESVWPEKPASTDRGGMSTEKRSKAEINDIAWLHMRMHIVATVKEAFGVQPKLRRVQVVAVREAESTPLADLQVLATASITSDEMATAMPTMPTNLEATWRDVLLAEQTWLTDESTTLGSALSRWEDASEDLIDEVESCIVQLVGSVQIGSVDGSGKIIPKGRLKDAIEGVDFESLTAEEGQFGSPVGTVADNPEALHYPEFWEQALAEAAQLRASDDPPP